MLYLEWFLLYVLSIWRNSSYAVSKFHYPLTHLLHLYKRHLNFCHLLYHIHLHNLLLFPVHRLFSLWLNKCKHLNKFLYRKYSVDNNHLHLLLPYLPEKHPNRQTYSYRFSNLQEVHSLYPH